jgi:hypothetical protein
VRCRHIRESPVVEGRGHGFEIGEAMACPTEIIRQDDRWATDHPLADRHERYRPRRSTAGGVPTERGDDDASMLDRFPQVLVVRAESVDVRPVLLGLG